MQDHEIWPQDTRKNALWYSVDIFTYDYFVLSGCKRLTDRRTDGQTDVDSKVQSNEVRCAQKEKTEALKILNQDLDAVTGCKGMLFPHIQYMA